MKRKYIYVFVGLLLLLAGGWYFWPEYGRGYSEQQRRLWNERRDLYPDLLVMNSASPNFSYGLERTEGLERGTGEAVLKERKKMEEVFIRQQEENRDRRALAWDAGVPECPDPAKLPLEGMAWPELVTLAEAGNGDACLLLAAGNLKKSWAEAGIAGISWCSLHEAEKWLDKAVEVKRPGAVFLRHYGAAVKNHLLQIRGFTDNGQGRELKWGDIPSPQSVQGYKEFLDAMKQGDSLLYLTVETILPKYKNVLEEKSILMESLREKAERGDLSAQKRLAQMFFGKKLRYIGGAANDIWSEMSQNDTKWENRLNNKLSPRNKERAMALLKKLGWMGETHTQSWKEYNEACGWTRELAWKGDLTGMYLWLRYGMASRKHISRRDWEDMFSCARILAESGYAPFLDDIGEWFYYIDSRGKLIFSDVFLAHAVLGTYYTGESLRAFRRECLKSLAVREGKPWRQQGWKASPDNIRELARLGYWEEMWSNCHHVFAKWDEESRTCYLSLMERRVEEGDLMAMYYLADIYEKGTGVPADLGRAALLRERILPVVEDYPFASISYSDKYREHGVEFPNAVRLRLIDMTLKYASYPGRDEGKAFSWACYVAKDKKFLGNVQDGLYCYLLGQVYERGIGTAPDKAKALEYYKVSANIHPGNVHKGCQESWDRLSAEMEKVK